MLQLQGHSTVAVSSDLSSQEQRTDRSNKTLQLQLHCLSSMQALPLTASYSTPGTHAEMRACARPHVLTCRFAASFSRASCCCARCCRMASRCAASCAAMRASAACLRAASRWCASCVHQCVCARKHCKLSIHCASGVPASCMTATPVDPAVLSGCGSVGTVQPGRYRYANPPVGAQEEPWTGKRHKEVQRPSAANKGWRCFAWRGKKGTGNC